MGALPAIRRLHGTVVVVVAGRAVLAPGALGEAFAEDLAFLRYGGARPVVVHDAGPEQVRRAPDEDEGTALRRVAAGLVQRRLVGLVNAHGPLAVGITGEDGHTLTRSPSGNLVADPGVLLTLLTDGRIPVVAAVAHGPDGVHPAETVTTARLLAARLSARHLLLPAGTVAETETQSAARTETGAASKEGRPATTGTRPIDTAVPHALLRTLYGLEAT
ncbi:hypothetical protein JK359_10015 [Streptomyces actinomycinicus]|uniref:acetylglutamate kinase n=1 Tax=Streptomyces actinomycinicus TaxID=1695166 RepID=A0A937JKA8_9ACTN|nr:hypothetical protein [Streptomyces actinomycinicus]